MDKDGLERLLTYAQSRVGLYSHRPLYPSATHLEQQKADCRADRHLIYAIITHCYQEAMERILDSSPHEDTLRKLHHEFGDQTQEETLTLNPGSENRLSLLKNKLFVEYVSRHKQVAVHHKIKDEYDKTHKVVELFEATCKIQEDIECERASTEESTFELVSRLRRYTRELRKHRKSGPHELGQCIDFYSHPRALRQ